MAMAVLSVRSRWSARGHRCESKSNAAVGRSRRSNASCSLAIPTFGDSVWRSPIGLRSRGSWKCRPLTVRQALYRRLQQLEAASVRARAQLESSDRAAAQERALNQVKLFLKLRGIEQNPMESLAEAWARALEISCGELKRLLRAGLDPIRKYFTEHGVYEEIERRKAAGTWPSG